jgi:hypothetical protein
MDIPDRTRLLRTGRDLPGRAMSRTLVGGTRLVGRRYFLGRREVVVRIGWGPGARIRNVRVRFVDDGSEIVRPFRGLTLKPRG